MIDPSQKAIYIKVQNGTPKSSGEFLCRTCQHGTRALGENNEELIHCVFFKSDITFKVIECNDYKRRGQPSLTSMSQTAWILDLDKKKNTYGFVKYNEWKKEREKKGDYDSFDDEF